jgi:acyl-CoA reductase-like NAD-dependent aldehyde dehydrogenase
MSTYKDVLKTDNFINNEWISTGNGNKLPVLEKYSNTPLAEVPEATEAQMETAIVSAVKAFEDFKTWSAGRRSAHLAKLADLLENKREAFIDLIIKEAGKPRGYATNEIDRCLTTIRTAVAETLRFAGETVPLDYGAGEGKTAFTKRFPVGVVACITPFNFPLNLLLHKVAPALATGCTVVIKPAPQSPLCTLALAALVKEAGYPAGVFNALACDIPVAEKLVRDDRVAKLSFTGSEKVGWYLKSICGRKKVTLELGGNAAVIIDESADLTGVAKKVAVGAFIYAGQICISTQRIFVHEKVYDAFEAELIKEVNALPVGDPNDAVTLVGPVIDSGHLKRIDEWVKEAVNSGAKLLCGGKIKNAEFNLFEPTLLTHTNNSMKVACAEVFGPVAIIEKVKSFEDAIARTNDSAFGLQAGVFTNRLDHFKMAHETLEVGGIIMNNIPGFRIDSMPYGGVKDSGLGREGIKYAMEEMTEGRLIVY